MAPEQARDSRATSIQSDIYSLGCTFYYLLTGVPPYPGGDITDKLTRHAKSPVPDVRELRQDVPDGIRGDPPKNDGEKARGSIRVVRRSASPRSTYWHLAAIEERSGYRPVAGRYEQCTKVFGPAQKPFSSLASGEYAAGCGVRGSGAFPPVFTGRAGERAGYRNSARRSWCPTGEH